MPNSSISLFAPHPPHLYRDDYPPIDTTTTWYMLATFHKNACHTSDVACHAWQVETCFQPGTPAPLAWRIQGPYSHSIHVVFPKVYSRQAASSNTYPPKRYTGCTIFNGKWDNHLLPSSYKLIMPFSLLLNSVDPRVLERSHCRTPPLIQQSCWIVTGVLFPLRWINNTTCKSICNWIITIHSIQ